MIRREEHYIHIVKISPTKRSCVVFDKFAPQCQYLLAIRFCVRSLCKEEMERGNSEK